MGLGCSGTCAKYILFIINFAVFVCGAVILGVGLALLLADEAWLWFDGITADSSDPLIQTAVYIMITVGGLLFIVGFFGCCGACKENKCMLTTYVVLVSILLLIQLTGVILAIVFNSEINDTFRTAMEYAVYYDYGGTDNNVTTLSWDAMQHDLKCCGSSGYEDYEDSYYFNTTGNIIPESCCSAATFENDEIDISSTEYRDCKAAANNGTDSPLYYDNGCYDELKSWVDENTAIVIGVLAGLGAVQLIGIILACCLQSSLQDANVYM